MTALSRWITISRPLAGARLRLICLPHAGAGASTYSAWGRALEPHGIEVRAVQYPGRERRLAEAPISDARTMVTALADQWPLIGGGGPCALYGHSMGALLGFELALELERRGAGSQPSHLLFGGRNPPHLARKLPSMEGLSDGDFLLEVGRHYGNMPQEILADAELCALITPVLRADFKLVHLYEPRSGDQVGAPLTIMGGTGDKWTTPEDLAHWQLYTRSSARVQMIEGDHFFHQKARDKVLAVIREALVRA